NATTFSGSLKHHEKISAPRRGSFPVEPASGSQDRHCMFLAFPLLTHGTQEAFHIRPRSFPLKRILLPAGGALLATGLLAAGLAGTASANANPDWATDT